jgi:hypothetical protein
MTCILAGMPTRDSADRPDRRHAARRLRSTRRASGSVRPARPRPLAHVLALALCVAAVGCHGADEQASASDGAASAREPTTRATSSGGQAAREGHAGPGQYAEAGRHEPEAAAAHHARVVDDLLADRGLGDGAAGWELLRASADDALGKDGGAAVALRPSEEGPARLVTLLRPAPAGESLRWSVLVQGLREGQRVNLRAVGTTAGGQSVLSTDRDVLLDVDAWRRGTLDVVVPPDAATLELIVSSRGNGPALVCEPSLRRAPAAAVFGPDTDLTALDAEGLAAASRAIELRVERLRGHVFEKPVPVEVVSDDGARDFFLRRLERDYPPERAARDQVALTQLGLWPDDLDLIEALLALLEEQAGGFYDPDVETFFLLSDMPGGIMPVLMAHELTHALDDQLYDIDGSLAEVKDDTDASMALASVVEGSGTLIMSAFMQKEVAEGRMSLQAIAEVQASEVGKAEALFSSPPLLARNLLAPYILGQRFLLRGAGVMAVGEFDRADIDRAFTRPPRSSEQIVHPEKYWGAEAVDLPRAVALPDLSGTLGPGWSMVQQDTLGELQLAVLTGSGLPDPNSLAAMSPSSWTNAAASGWGGDRWLLYAHEDGRRHATLLATLWDTERDVGEFARAVRVPEGAFVLHERDALVIVAGEAGAAAEALGRAALDALVSGP